MNTGKICVSVCAETTIELVKKLKLIDDSVDVVEIRFDCLDKSELEKIESEDFQTVLKNVLSCGKQLLTTFRIKEQGGKREIPDTEREAFWKVNSNFGWADFEEDIIKKSFSKGWNLKICSQHDFQGVPKNLGEIYQRLSNSGTDIIKIAVQTKDITDTIPIWSLLKRAKSEHKQIIPIAMGESGKWTRILGLAHGAFMTYASIDSANETAPGQVSAEDLINVYRAKELGNNSNIYGILGSNTSVSMSPYIHNEAFKYHNLNSVFLPLQVQDLDNFMRRMVKTETREVDLNFAGFAVTIPHKQSVIKHLDSLDDSAKAIGAVNTVKFLKNKLYGYNTDAAGFIAPLLKAFGSLKDARVAVLGAGGAARACIYALKREGADVEVFARNISKSQSLTEEFGVKLNELNFSEVNIYKNFDILVNTTPLGMKGKAANETPATAEQLKGLSLVYDLIYIPFQTKLMQEADSAGVSKVGGLDMLIAQAVKQQKIWTGLNPPIEEMRRAAIKRLKL